MPTFVYFSLVKEETRKSCKINSSEALIKGIARTQLPASLRTALYVSQS